MTEDEFFSRKRYLFLIPTLMVAAIIAEEMATDIFLPSIPLMGDYFGVSEVKAQLTISMYLLGLSIARPFYGVLSDSFGRRRVLLGGMMVFFLASLACYFVDTIRLLIACRFIQGWGAGVAIVIGFAAVKDIFDEKKCAHIMSLMGLVIAVSPAIAPIVGGYLSKYYGWQSTFLFIICLSGVIFLCIWLFMTETLPRKKQVPFSMGGAARHYFRVLMHTRFILYTVIQALSVGALWTWLAGAPVLYIDHLHVPLEIYGYFGAAGVGFYMLGTLLNIRLIAAYTVDTVLFMGLIILTAGALIMLLGGAWGTTNPITIQLLNAPVALGLAFILPNATTGALDSIDTGRGIGASIVGTAQMGMGALGSFLVGYYGTGNLVSIVSIMLVMFVMAGFSFAALMRVKHKSRSEPAP